MAEVESEDDRKLEARLKNLFPCLAEQGRGGPCGPILPSHWPTCPGFHRRAVRNLVNQVVNERLSKEK